MATVVDFPPSETLRPEQAIGEVAKTKWEEFNDQIARYNFAQQMPYNKLAQYMGLIQGNYGGTTTMTEPYDAAGALLSRADSAFGLGAKIFGDDLGWAGGLLSAGLGAALGFL